MFLEWLKYFAQNAINKKSPFLPETKFVIKNC